MENKLNKCVDEWYGDETKNCGNINELKESLRKVIEEIFDDLEIKAREEIIKKIAYYNSESEDRVLEMTEYLFKREKSRLLSDEDKKVVNKSCAKEKE